MAERDSRKDNFMVQGAILGIASIVVRLIGIIYRVPLNNILGERGMAYYGVAYDVYSILLILSSYSMPLAVSKMVSARVAVGEYKNTKRVLGRALLFALGCGVAAFAITFFGADIFAKLWNYPQSALALKVLSPALVIMSVLGVLRGYFQGLGTMVPTAISNIVEQIVNAIVSVVAAMMLGQMVSTTTTAAARSAAGGTLGTVMGALTGLIFLAILFWVRKKKLDSLAAADTDTELASSRTILKVLVATIVPVIVSTTIYNIGSLVDTGLFSNIMKAKAMDQETIEVLTGMYTGNYRLLINVPIALASALASSLIPSIVTSMTRKEATGVKRKIESAIRLIMVIAMPCTVGMGVLAKPIINLLFPSSVNPDKVAGLLILGCISIVLYSLSTITNSVLQGIDKMRLPVRHSAISLGIHVIVLAALLFLTDLNIYAVVIADILFALIICILNQRAMKKHLGYRQEITKSFILPGICSVVMGILTFLYNFILTKIFGSSIAVIISIILAVITYGILLLLFRAIDEKELKMIPMGGKIVRVAKKLHLMR